MSKRWRGITSSTTAATANAMGRFQTRSGHVCVICGFVPTTKNKYRELQDHLVRVHFRDAIKASLPTRRPYLCPEKDCNVEGKDWQALMRHYTGKHGILDAYLKEALSLPHENNNHHHQQHTPPQHLPVVETATLDHETLFIQDNVIHQEVSTMDAQSVADPQQRVEVVTSFELPTMMTTTLDATATTITTTESCLQAQPQQFVTHHELTEAQPQPAEIEIQNFQEVLGSEEEEKDKILSTAPPQPPTTTTTVLNNEELAAQVNTVSSTIPFPTTIPLMLGATATKRPKTEPDIVINNGQDAENYAFVDLKYFIADPSKVMALPYKIILPQMEEEEEMKSFETRIVQTDIIPPPSSKPLTTSVQVQTDPWYPCTGTSTNCRRIPSTDQASTQTPSIKTESVDTSSAQQDIKELDFSMF